MQSTSNSNLPGQMRCHGMWPNYTKTVPKASSIYVWDQMFCYEAKSVEAYSARAVQMVQVEGECRQAGLIPVTWVAKNQEGEGPMRVDPIEVDAICRPEVNEAESD